MTVNENNAADDHDKRSEKVDNDMNDNSISIVDIFKLLWSKAVILIIALIVGAGAAFGYTELFMPLKYSSHISMYVQSYTGISNDSVSEYNDISKSKQLINTYIQVLKDDAVMESVGDALTEQFEEKIISENFSAPDGKIKPSSLASVITISTVTDTSAINIVATTKNAELSAAVCNELCKQANHFTTKAIGVGEIKSIDTAKVYNTPVAPNKVKNTVIGGIAAFMIAALIIFMIDFFDNTIKSTEALEKKYQKAILGEINDISVASGKKKKDKNSEEKRLTLLDKDVPFEIVESCKSMRTNIMFALSTAGNKTLAVSSPNPGEGKSTTAANIAIPLAEGGQKILLIDADMRKPVQHKIFGAKNDAGLSSVLSKMKKAEECIQETDVENLSILTSGPIPPNPSELLASENASELLKALSAQYDVIVIDTPPINTVSDSLNLSKSVAGILVVVRYGYTTDEELKNAVGKISLAKMNLMGFVLNDIVKKHRRGYYGKYGKYGYKKRYAYEYGLTAEKKEESK